MKINKFMIDPELQDINILRVTSPCPCGCSKFPAIVICGSKEGMNVEFENEIELKKFKLAVNKIKMDDSGPSKDFDLTTYILEGKS